MQATFQQLVSALSTWSRDARIHFEIKTKVAATTEWTCSPLYDKDMTTTIMLSPRTERRRRRELELEARRLANAHSSSSSTDNNDDESSDDAVNRGSGGRSRNRRVRRSYRQMVRSKQQQQLTSGRAFGRAVSADRQKLSSNGDTIKITKNVTPHHSSQVLHSHDD